MYILRFKEREKHKIAVDWAWGKKIRCWAIYSAALEIHMFTKEDAQNLAQHLREKGFAKGDVTSTLTKDEPEYPDGIGWFDRLWDSPLLPDKQP